MCELFVGAQLENYERKYKPMWSFVLLTNYDGTKADKKQSDVGDDTDMKPDITTKGLRGNGINIIKIRGHV